jgi:hypothetical protein
VDDDTFNVVEVNIEAPQKARCGESAGVSERGMYGEKTPGILRHDSAQA